MDSIVVGRKDGGTVPDRFWEEASDIFYQDLGKAKRAKLDDTIRLEDTIKSRTLIGVSGGEFEEFKKIVDDAREKRDALKGTADVAFKTAAIGILEGDSKILEDVYEVINAVMVPDLKVIQAELSKTRQYEEEKDLEKAFRELKDWLLAGTSAKIQAPKVQHLGHLKHRHPGICRWILRAPEYETWRDQKHPSLRHLFGEAATGNRTWYQVSSKI
ncbi:hypothetical protein HO133_006184 [Letharia lupina]|uniref:Uncharacterized protein n=1 Tax=Letharia lupina TaxID=560253 RepID=A0A8H6F837_9LECA|nr:uncharacterized protein HO133_006184 [Letharia lupina]KAF6218223.1 hypothetical protein HO133_006184 [Letharia lupina]